MIPPFICTRRLFLDSGEDVFLIDDSVFQNIAQAIREKNGTTDTYTPEEMAGAILAITGEAEVDDGTIKFTIDGVTYKTTPNTNWYNWVGTDYNTGSRFARYNDGTYWRVKDTAQDGTPDIYHNGSRVIANSIIIEGASYTTGA